MTFYRFAQESSTGRNSRIDSLFNVLGVSRERLYQGVVSKIDDSVDWNSIDNNLEKLRRDSIAFLKESLS